MFKLPVIAARKRCVIKESNTSRVLGILNCSYSGFSFSYFFAFPIFYTCSESFVFLEILLCSGFSWGCSWFREMFRVLGVFRDVAVFRVPVFLKILHALHITKNEHFMSYAYTSMKQKMMHVSQALLSLQANTSCI